MYSGRMQAGTAWAGLAALAVAMGVGRFAFTPVLPMMDLSLAQGGLLASANYLGYLAGALCAGWLAHPRTPIRLALATIGLSTLAMGLVHGLAAWAVLRFLAGMASAWALVHVSAWSLARLPGSVARGAVFSGVGLGMAFAGALCLAVIAMAGTADAAWITLGVASCFVAAVLWPAFHNEGTSPPQGKPFKWTADAVRLVGCYFAFGFGYIIPATFIPAMAKAAVPDPAVFGWAWPVFGATAALSTVVAGRLTSAPRTAWIAAAWLMAAGVAAPLAVPGIAGILVAALLVGGTFMVITMAGMQEARRVAGAGAPRLMAALTSAFAVGQIVGPLVAGAFDIRHSLAIASAALVVSALALPERKVHDAHRPHATARPGGDE